MPLSNSASRIACAAAPLLLAAGLVASPAVSTTAQAQGRPSTKSFTCSEVKRFVRQRGAVVMSHKARHLYRRFVAHRGYCDFDEIAVLFRVPTRTGTCFLKICQPGDRFLFDRD